MRQRAPSRARQWSCGGENALLGALFCVVFSVVLYINSRAAGRRYTVPDLADYRGTDPSLEPLPQKESEAARKWEGRILEPEEADQEAGVVKVEKPLKAIIAVMTPCYDGPMTRADRLSAVARSWGYHISRVAAVDFQVIYVTPDDSLPDDIQPQLRVPDRVHSGGSSRATGRVQRWVLGEIHRLHNPDFLVLCEDHTFIIKENLACYLKTLEPAGRVYAGHTLVSQRTRFNTNAAGFVLSRGALETVLGMSAVGSGAAGATASSKKPKCDPTQPQWLSLCVSAAGFAPLDTKVAGVGAASGAQRFNVYGPVRLVRGEVDPWFKGFHQFDYGATGQLMPRGTDCCAADLISFHYIMPAEQLHLYDMVYSRERYLAMEPLELEKAWPTAQVDKNFRPRANEAGVWNLLLRKLQICTG